MLKHLEEEHDEVDDEGARVEDAEVVAPEQAMSFSWELSVVKLLNVGEAFFKPRLSEGILFLSANAHCLLY